MIDAPPVEQAAGLTVRADGYRIHIAGETKSDFTPPLKSLADVKAGDWIKYKGKLTASSCGGGRRPLRSAPTPSVLTKKS